MRSIDPRALLAFLLFAALLTAPFAAPPPAAADAVHDASHARQDGDQKEDEKEKDEDDEEDGEDGEDEDEEDEKPKWNVDDPPGEEHEVALDVDEGTWMSLDVSPDGREIVFDLLGDLYTVPITGGDATALTHGMAWDMQPRYSPDGKSIAFTSDRGGGDNVWVMGRDGAAPRQVTEEDFRLLNSPAWSPDGEWIAARKHFTSRRSLGAGEIWLYHRSGGDGLQLNERPNDQKDLGEPAFSPDGRYVYFSRDSTPGQVFEYNKDPNTEIYTIQRLDRETGEIEPFVTGPGGAVRPTPSPDGKSLAFVRRVRYKTALFVEEIASGRHRMLTDALDRDMQETWAIHGVYPAMAWTPDSRSLVYWAGGKIHRIDAATGEDAVIPFRVRQTLRLSETLRFPVDPAPAEVDLKMLRWVEVSPAGDRVVFQALGRLWVRDLPAGEPRQLTRQSDHFELYPSFSRDGRSIVYVTWHDDELGSVRIAPATGGEGRALTREPGHYLEPVFSPDGATVVYRKAAGGSLLSPLYSRDTGLYAVSAAGAPGAGGEPVRIATSGEQPHFGAASDRVYFLHEEEEDKRSLRSLELAPRSAGERTERVHLMSEGATAVRVSPDGRWVAFTERFNVWVAPFVAASKAVEVGPKMTSLPVHRVSRDTGDSLHWSGDGKTLHWSLGPELFSRELKDAFAFLEDAPEELPEPPATGVDLGFAVPADVPTGKVALVGGRVLTMAGEGEGDGEGIIADGTVIVEGNRITAVGPADEVAVPADALRIDVAGKTVMPGIIDVHWHGSQGNRGIVPQRNWYDYSSLAFGVTTIHDPSTTTSTFFAAAEMARAGLITAPRLFSTGTILYGAAGDFKAQVDSLEDARSHLRRLKAVGAWSVKSYNQPRRDQRQQIVAAARELEMMVVPEGGSLFEHNMTMVVDGHTGIEHSIPVAEVYADVVELWAATRTGYTPTLVVGYGGIWGEDYWYAHTDVWEDERLLAFTPAEEVEPRSRRRTVAPEEEYNHFAIARVAKELADAGVLVELGAHGQREGLGAHWELWMFAQGGMTPIEALRTATLNGARYLGLDHDLGSLEAGKLADLIVLDADPLADVRNSTSIRYTMVNGRLYDARTMDEVGNHPRQRGALYFEKGE